MTGLRLTVAHHSAFNRSLGLDADGLRSAASWDVLRTAEPSGNFGFGSSRVEWAQRALTSVGLRARAAAIVTLLRDWNAAKLVSVGVGTGTLEYLIKHAAPDVRMRCGDFAPTGVALLKERFVECDWIGLMSLAEPAWVGSTDEVVLLHRVDMELTDDEWPHLFTLLGQRGCERVILVPCGLLTTWTLARELYKAIRAATRGQVLRRAGFLRTQSRMRQLFEPDYQVTRVVATGDLPIWALERTT